MMKKRHSRFLLWFDRLLSKSLLQQFAILGVVLFALFLLSWFFLHISGCEWKQFAKDSNVSEWLLPLYLLIDTNAFNNLYINGIHGWALFVSSITFIIGAFIFNGAIIAIITNSIERRVANHNEGYIHYLKSGHYIIMGYDDMVPSFISHIFDTDKDAYVLVLSSTESTVIKEKLSTSFSEEKMKHIIVNYGHKTSMDYYQDIHLETAEHVFIIGDHHKPAHDAINVECVDSVYRYLSDSKVTQRPGGITCVFKDLDTYAAFKTSDIFKKLADLGIAFTPYNFYSGWAKQVFVKREYKDFDNPDTNPYKYPAVYGKGITPDNDKYVHLVFVGTTNFAVAFAMEAAHVLHFPNFDNKKQSVKTRITFIEKNADKEKDEFIIRNRHFFEVQLYYYRDLSENSTNDKETQCTEFLQFSGDDANFLDVEFEFIKGDVFSKKVQDEISNWASDTKNQYLSLFLALSDQRQNFVMGMNMPDAVYDNEIPVFIRQDRSDNFVTNLRNVDKKNGEEKLPYATVSEDGTFDSQKRDARYANIYPFGMNETAFSADNRSLKRAKLINYLYETANYNTYKFQGLLALDAIPERKIWADADAMWHKLSVALKWSNLYNSYTIRTKLACLRAMRGLNIEDKTHDYDSLSEYEVDVMARVEHNRWNVEKLLMGYRKPKKNEDKYAHPEFAGKLKKNKNLYIHHDIRPYDDLDIIKELDHEFSRYIPWIMKMTEGK
jgi:hypothetical protein